MEMKFMHALVCTHGGLGEQEMEMDEVWRNEVYARLGMHSWGFR